LPKQPYPQRACFPQQKIMPIFEMFRALRFADENIYLRAASLNIINGMIGLNFPCDGSPYMHYKFFWKEISASGSDSPTREYRVTINQINFSQIKKQQWSIHYANSNGWTGAYGRQYDAEITACGTPVCGP
jgi:hypothetical protein